MVLGKGEGQGSVDMEQITLECVKNELNEVGKKNRVEETSLGAAGTQVRTAGTDGKGSTLMSGSGQPDAQGDVCRWWDAGSASGTAQVRMTGMETLCETPSGVSSTASPGGETQHFNREESAGGKVASVP